MTDPAPTPARWSVKLAAMLLALALVLCLGEFGARVIFPRAEISNFDRAHYSQQMISGPLLSQASLAHASFRVESAPDQAQSIHKLNLYGFRDGEWRARKTPGRKRILVIGDSMVEGFLVSEEQTIPRVLEKSLRSAGEDVEVWNMGVGGSGLAEYAQLLRDVVPMFDPDEVIFVLYANDILASVGFAFKPSQLKPLVTPHSTSAWKPHLATVLAALARGDALPRRWHQAPFSFFPIAPSPANPWTAKGADYERFVAPDLARAMRDGRFNPFNVGEVQGYEHYLRQDVDLRPWYEFVKGILSVRQIPFSMTFIPQPSQVTDHYLPFKQRYCPPGVPSLVADAYQQGTLVARTQAEKMGIPFRDMTAALRDHETRGDRMYWNYDEHMRQQGYAVVAEGILDLRAKGVGARP